ncbi:thiopurine S-methyltransferase [Coraliomargarita sinensis]|uniref:Thiopurine S-methyltransferase n=1 Tax=Coraliomargarita sinensis TaxID=2174842 RepID=A0A317ZGX6_9BACT|nr:methyltransferase domain-containing protein [Coraliomargarita sinensis]PXA03029.1 thiopurine S-methyltransferase [Coraliomargarita sinensis]
MARDWDKAYEVDETPWDKGYAAPPLMKFLKEHSLQGRALVPGCGTGHDVRLLAKHGVQVTGLDIAPGALRKAAAFAPVGGESYVLGDFLNPEAGLSGSFDWVVEHTCLCAIEPSQREAYLSSLNKVLKRGGQFLAVFFREVSNYDGDGPPHPISGEEIHALFHDDFELVESYTPRETYPSRPVGCEEVCWMRKRGA